MNYLQVLRVSLALAAVLGRPLHIHSIRAGRSETEIITNDSKQREKNRC